MDIKSLEGETYIPKFNGNQELPKHQQVSAVLEFPTIEAYEPFAGTGDNPPDAIGIVRKYVKVLTNVTSNGAPIENGEQLVKCRRGVLSDLVNELFVRILTRNRLTGEQEKNSEGQPSSS
jgi:hypothetical protein